MKKVWIIRYQRLSGSHFLVPVLVLFSLGVTKNPDAPVSVLAPSHASTLKPIPALCREVVLGLPEPGLLRIVDPAPYLIAAECLRRDDPVASPRIRNGLADSLLKAKLPNDLNWYLTHLERFRLHRDLNRILDMAFLGEMKFSKEPSLYRELSEVYTLFPGRSKIGLAYLRMVELDPEQAGFVQYKLGNLLRESAGDFPPGLFLDSLTALYPHVQAKTAEVLETACWEFRDYPCAYLNFIAFFKLRSPGPSAALDRVNRLQSQGYFDYASSILELLAWNTLSQPWKSMARTLDLQIRFQMKDWSAIALLAEPKNGENPPVLSNEESYIVATALVKLGHPDAGLLRLKNLEDKAPAPWGFKSRLLKAQAFLSQGKSKEASETLTALKKDPSRAEGTGPILFWQGCLAIAQGRFVSAESLLVLASAYTGSDEAQRALEFRFFLLQDTGGVRTHFFNGLSESPKPANQRIQSLNKVEHGSPLWPFAQLEKAQILVQTGHSDSAEVVLDDAARRSTDRLAGFQAEAKAAYLQEKLPGGKQAALVRYEDLLVKYQQGVIPEFSRGRIKTLK